MAAYGWASMAVMAMVVIVTLVVLNKPRRWLSNNAVIVFMSLIMVLAWAAQFATGFPAIFRSDTILTLSLINATLLLILTTSVSFGLLWFTVYKSEYLQRKLLKSTDRGVRTFGLIALGDLVLTLAISWMSLSLAPQLFYQLYIMIIPGLPYQWVSSVVNPLHMITWIQLGNSSTLSALATGALLLAIAFGYLLTWLHLAVNDIPRP